MSGSVAIASRGSGWLAFVFAALLAHGAFCVLMLIARTAVVVQDAGREADLVLFNLVPPAEGDASVYMASANPDVSPPEGRDDVSDAEIVHGGDVSTPAEELENGISDAALADILAKEREALKQELEQMSQLAMAQPLPEVQLQVPPPANEQEGGSAPGPEGAIRELDLDGYPQAIVEDIMKRYNLKVVTRRIEGGRRGQSFLSSASRGTSERYFGGMAVPSGVYEVFLLSRESVALMSRLEENALIAKGLEPLKSRVIRIVFGIVEDNKGGHALGVKSLEAEAVEP